MKRFLALALSLLMILGILLMAGCTNTGTSDDTTTGTKKPAGTTAGTTTAGTTAGTTEGTTTEGTTTEGTTTEGTTTEGATNEGTTTEGTTTEGTTTEGTTTEGTTAGNTTENTTAPIGGGDTPTGQDKMPGYEDIDFGGAVFKIVGCDGEADGFNSAKEIYSEESDAISVSVRNRNQIVELLYNCKIQGVASASPAGDAATEVTGNQHTITLYTHHYAITSTATAGQAYNFMTIGSKEIDFSQPWWDQQYVKSYTINNSQAQPTLYSIVGDFALTTFDCTHALVYNKTVFQNEPKVNHINMYQLVRDKKWTMDQFEYIVKNVAKDSNGDQVYESLKGDVAGWIRTGHATHGLHVASGLSIIKNTNGVLTFDVDKNTETWSAVIDKSKALWALPQGETLGYSDIPATLASGNACFASEILGSSLGNLKDYDAEIGLLPYPLHSETQENYAHYVDNHVYSYSIPTSWETPDAAADFLTVYAYASRYIVRPTYINVYAYDYCADEESAEMLDIILSTMTYDPGYLSSTPNLEADLSNMITNNKNNVAQFAARKAANANSWISTLIAGIDDNEV